MDIKVQIEQILQDSLRSMDVEDSNSIVSPSNDSSHGEYTTNVAMVIAKKLGKSPMEVAEEIAGTLKIENGKLKNLDRVEVVKPGFINFFVKKEMLGQAVEVILGNKKTINQYQNKTIVVEFTDANPFKEMHIGHLFSNVVGESISRLLESQGAKVIRVCYQGDVGMHVAKSLWGLQKLVDDLPSENADLKTKARFLGKAYALGATAYEEDPGAKDEIIHINKQVYAKDSTIMEMYTKGKRWSLEYFDILYKRLGTKFEHFYFESEVAERGVALVKAHIDDGIFEKSEGAIVFNAEEYGLHTRVFINSLGLPTYEAKELGLAPTKYDDYHYDASIIITGNEIIAYFTVLLKALSLIYPDLASKTKHFSHGMLRLSTGKISSRKGNVPTAEDLLNQAVEEVKKIAEMDDILADQVGIGAVKYALLKNSIGKDISFNFAEAVNVEGNSGPYLQYTFVRCQSILRKSQSETIGDKLDFETYTFSQEEFQLLRTISFFQQVISQAAEQFAPHILATYLFTLAQQFNLFYQKDPILKAEKKQQEMRLFLVSATAKVLKDGLKLLGIESPEKM